MANSKISALTSATTPLAGTETLPIVQSSTTKQVSVANLTDGRAVNALSLQLTSNVGNVEPLVLSSGSIGTVGNTIGIRAGYTGTTYQKGGLIYQSADGNGRGAWNICCQNGANSSNVTISDSILKIDYSGDVTYKIGNLVQGTAAKGINFTANTPAAGMTSQLLNWYEEGTWTPTQGAGLVVVGAFTSSGRYTRVGRQVTVSGTLRGATSIACTAGGVFTTGIPFTLASAGAGVATSSNLGGTVLLVDATTYSVSAMAASGALYMTATYSV
tara:strand:- start:2326 stop:3141 length:816 start_codon:yes stop_codon:yes gene_type:complete